jgi:uncharacterized Tic20 family protein
MKNQICEFEKAVVNESTRGVLSERLKIHVKDCADCREVLRVAAWLQNFAAEVPKRPLPTAGFIWWKSKIIEKQAAGRRAAQPILWTQTIAVIVAVVASVWFGFTYQSKFAAVIENFSASIEIIAIPSLIALVCAAFICVVIAFKWRESSGKN